MFGNLYDAAGSVFRGMACLLIITVPLGLWKLVELVHWAFS